MPVLYMPPFDPRQDSPVLFPTTFATMLYPTSEVRREQWFASSIAATYASWGERDREIILANFHGWIGTLWELPQSPKRVFQDGIARMPRALIAGHVLTYLLMAAEHHPHHCRVERATLLAAEFPLPGGQRKSESLVAKAWAEFKTVAHIWGAYISVVFAERGPVELEDVQWLDTLGLAETLRGEAERARIFTLDEAWRVEDERVVEHEIAVPPLDEVRLQFLDSQFPA